MVMVTPGLLELAFTVVFGVGSGLGLPLGVPPAPESPLMAAVAPEECLFYTTWSGMAEPDPESPNHTEQLLAEPEVQHFVAAIEKHIRAGVARYAERQGEAEQQLARDATDWVKTLLTRQAAVFVSEVNITGDSPDVRGAAIVHLGEDAASIRASLEKYQRTLGLAVDQVEIDGQPWHQLRFEFDAPSITWGLQGQYLIAGIGEGSVEGVLARARTPKPAWLEQVHTQLPVPRRSTVTYVNLRAIIDISSPIAGPRVRSMLDAIGLGNVTTLSSVTGLDAEGFVSRTLLSLDGPTSGALASLVQSPLTPDDLRPIPADATLAIAARLNASEVFEAFLAAVERIEPQARAEIIEELGEMEEDLQISIRADLLKSLGDVWRIYNSPGEGGLVVTGLTGVVTVRDRTRLAAVEERLVAALKAEFDQGDEHAYGRPRIEQFTFAGRKVYFLNARDDDFLAAPAWCLTDDELIVTTFPQHVKAYLARPDGQKSLATVPEVAGLFADGAAPVGLSYVDVPEMFKLAYPFVPAVGQLMAAELVRKGVDVDVSILPSAPAIGKHLRPSVTAIRRTDGGIEVISRQTLPGGSIGASLPAVALTGVQSITVARGRARQVQSLSNMRQIAMALFTYQVEHAKLPAAYTVDEDGKPLLSWRVTILPYLSQQGQELYDQFHLDEPWDSEHNRKLIEKMPSLYRCTSSRAGTGKTVYLTVRSPRSAFPGKEGIAPNDIENPSNTVLLVEASDALAVPWTKPADYNYDPKDPAVGLVRQNAEAFNAAFCDGSVRSHSKASDPAMLRAMFERTDIAEHGQSGG